MASTRSSISFQVSQGSEKHAISVTTDSNVGALKQLLHEKTGIPCEAQKLIFKGRHLQDDDESVTGAGIKEGSKLMLIGRKVDPAHDEYIKLVEEIKDQVATVQRKLKSIEQDLEGMEKGFLSDILVPEKCSQLEKQCLSCNESLMQILERLDAVVPLASDTQVRTKRRSVVQETQVVMTRTDEIGARIKSINGKHST